MPTPTAQPRNPDRTGRNPENVGPLTELTNPDAKRTKDLANEIRGGAAANRDAMEADGEALTQMNRTMRGKGPARTGSNATENAQATEQEQKKARPGSINVSGFEMPSNEELIQESEVAKGLDQAELEDALEEGKTLDFRNAIQTMNFGLEEQQSASKVTREYIDELRGMDLVTIAERLGAMNSKMFELKIGDLEPSFVDKVLNKVLGKKKADEAKLLLDKHKTLTEILDLGTSAMAEERAELVEHHANMQAKIQENEGAYQSQGKKIAALEISYAKNKKLVDEMKVQYEHATDPRKARDIAMMDEALARQIRRANSIKASRMETLNSIRTMDLQLSGIENQIAMIDEQAAFNRLVFDNSVLMAATDQHMKKSVEAVKFNREQIEEMLKNRTGTIAETLRKIIVEQQKGVVTTEVMQVVVNEIMKMTRARIEGNQKLRETMKLNNEIYDRQDKLVKDATAHAAAMTEGDVAKLDEILAAGGVTAETEKVDENPIKLNPEPPRKGFWRRAA